jgi:hypothetical protein
MQSYALPLAILVLVLLGIVMAIRRALDVLVVDFEAGKIAHAHGRAPPELLREIEDVGLRAGATGRLILRLEGGVVVVRTRGLKDVTEQRLRNVVGRFPKARLTQAPKL